MTARRRRFSVWPRNMAGRTVMLLLVSLTVFHLGSLWMHQHGLRDAIAELDEAGVANRIVSTAQFGMLGGADTIASTTVMAIGIIGASVLLVRWLTGPLRRLAEAADSIGRGRTITVPQDEPEEVQRVARALDAMQARITRLLDDRTQALAAVSHDLRTPITRLRLRAGFIDDPETQARIDADLNEMESMIAATLAYLQGGADTGPPQLTDVGALLSTLCHAAADAGGEASFDGPPHLDLRCRPIALRRAASNLIGNAVAYGGTARVRLEARQNEVVITVEDSGPGIPEAELERVFEPFRRLEASRNRSTGGVGLGLTIARQAITEQGGTLTLGNLPGGGLRAVIRLPDTGLQDAVHGRTGLNAAITNYEETSHAST